MTIPRLRAMQSYWASFPPLHILVAQLVGHKPKLASEPAKNANNLLGIEIVPLEQALAKLQGSKLAGIGFGEDGMTQGAGTVPWHLVEAVERTQRIKDSHG